MLERYLASQGSAGSAIFAVTGFLATAFLIGWGLLGRRLNLRPHETFFLSLTLGIDLVVVLATPFLWLGLLPSLVVKVIFTLGLIGVAALLVLRRAALTKLWNGVPWHLLPFLLLALLLFKNAIGYPYSYDDLTYQIAVPIRWLKAESLEVFRDNPFSAFAGVNLISNLLLLKAGGLLAPLLFNRALGLVLALAVYFLVRARTGPWTAAIFSLSFVTSLSFLMVTMSAFAEPWILLQFTALLFLLQRSGRQAWEILLMGFFAGMAASVKLIGFIMPVGMAVYLTACGLARQEPTAPSRIRQLVTFLGPLLLVLLLFYSRPYLATGDPVYPYFAQYFSTDEATLAMSRYHHDAGKLRFGPPLKGFWQTALFYCETPLLLCLDPLKSYDGGVRPRLERFIQKVLGADSATTFDGSFGLQGLVHLVLVAGLILSACRQRFRGKPAGPPEKHDLLPFIYLGGAALFYTFWFFTAQQARFLLPGYLCVILAGSCARDLLTGSPGKVMVILLAVLTLWSLPKQIVDHVAMSWQSEMEDPATHQMIKVSPLSFAHSAIQDEYLPACAMVANQETRPEKILLLYEQRGLFIPCDYVIGTPFFQERFFTPPDRIDSEFLEASRREKITHVLVGVDVKDPDRMAQYMARAVPVKQCLLRLESHGLKRVDAVRVPGPGGRDRDVYVLYAVTSQQKPQ